MRKVLSIIIAIFAIIIMAGCSNGTTDIDNDDVFAAAINSVSPCGCPIGAHFTGSTCCSNADCKCVFIEPLDMVYAAGGNFEIGKELGAASDMDILKLGGHIENSHQVTLRSFSISKNLVTQEQWKAVMGSLPALLESKDYGKGNKYPVYYISWYEALGFCNRLSVMGGLIPYYNIYKVKKDPNNTSSQDTFKYLITVNKTANGYRLPTEAQWEYAAKGGNTGEKYTFAGSSNLSNVSWNRTNSGGKTHEVATRTANGLGIYDMTGNVYEWCWDWYGAYTSGAVTDPAGPVSGNLRVRRGGGWNDGGGIRTVYRQFYSPDSMTNDTGFRVVRP